MTNLSASLTEPQKPSVWFYQIFNFNSFFIFIFLTTIFLTEVKFDLIEKMAGNFLKWHNHERQKLGRIWDIELQNIEALGQLNELLIKKEKKRERIGGVENFLELFELLKTDPLITLTKDQFIKIYNRLPSTISSNIIAPYDLIRYFHRSGWVKTFVFQKGTGIEIIMIDRQYGVLNSILISERDTKYLANFGKSISTSLENLEELSSRIFDASEFIEALYRMSPEARNKIIPNPFDFLAWGNRLKRIGISEISEDNLVQMGFEIHTSSEKKVVIIYVDDYLISSLIQLLADNVASTSNTAGGA